MEETLATPPRMRTGRRMSSFDVPGASPLAEPARKVPTAASLFRRRVSLDDGAHQQRSGGSPHPLARRKMSVGPDVSFQIAKSKSSPSTSGKTASAGSPTMVCSFGGNEFAQLGCEGVLMHTEPQPIEPLDNVIYISAGWTANIALTCTGNLHCWGTLMWPGSEDRTQWSLPTRLDTASFRSVKQIVIAKSHALLLTADGEVFAFGDGRWGKLGNGTTSNEPYPAKVGFDLANVKVEQIAAGEDHSVILTQSGEVYTFGKGANGQLGHGNRNDCSRPTKVRQLAKKKNKIRFVAAGFDQTICISSEGEVYSFGKAGPWLGYDVRQALVTVPKRVNAVKNLKKIVSAAVGQSHTLLLAQTGEVYSMGDNKNGCLGLGEHVDKTSDPMLIERLQGHNILQICAGAEHSLVLCEDGHVFSWGHSATGRLGCGDVLSTVYEPQQVTGIEGRPLAVSAGLQHSLILTAPTLSMPDVVETSSYSPVSSTPVRRNSVADEGAAAAAAAQLAMMNIDPDLPGASERTRSLDRSGGSSGSDSSPSTTSGSGGIDTLRRGVKKVVRKRLASFSVTSSSRRRGSLSQSSPNSPTPQAHHPPPQPPGLALSTSGSGSAYHPRGGQHEPDWAEEPYMYHQHGYGGGGGGHSPMYPPPPQYGGRVDYNHYVQAELLRARSQPQMHVGSMSPPQSAMSPQGSMSPRMSSSPAASAVSSPATPARGLDPKVCALLRELNYHEDEGVTSLFIEGRISWEALRTFTKADLAELGLPFGPRTAIFNLLQTRSSQSTPSSSLQSSQEAAPLSPTTSSSATSTMTMTMTTTTAMASPTTSTSTSMPATPSSSGGMRARIGYDDLTFLCKLGTGAFGDVWKGKLRGTTTVAIKTLKANGDYEDFRVEAQIMAELPAHPNVVTFFGAADADKGLYIVTEFVPDGSLDRYLLEQGARIEQAVLVQMIKDVAAGMDHLSTHGIVHRDLAARNLLVEVKRSGYHRVKVCDFGLALEGRDVDDLSAGSNGNGSGATAVRPPRDGPAGEQEVQQQQQQRQQRLTNVPVRWTAIEVLLHGRYTSKSDVWSFGVTVWEIFSGGQVPYADLSTFEIVDLLLRGYKLPRPARCPVELYERIVLRCLADDPDDRPTFHEIYRTLDALFPTIYASAVVDLHHHHRNSHRARAPAAVTAAASSFVPRLALDSPPLSSSSRSNRMPSLSSPALLTSSSSVPTSATAGSSSSSSHYVSPVANNNNNDDMCSPYGSVVALRHEDSDSDDSDDTDSDSDDTDDTDSGCSEVDDSDGASQKSSRTSGSASRSGSGTEEDLSVFSPYGSVELSARANGSRSSSTSSCSESSLFSPYGSVELPPRGAESTDTSGDEREEKRRAAEEREAKQAHDVAEKNAKKTKKTKKTKSKSAKKEKKKSSKKATTAKKVGKAKEVDPEDAREHDDVEPAPEVS